MERNLHENNSSTDSLTKLATIKVTGEMKTVPIGHQAEPSVMESNQMSVITQTQRVRHSRYVNQEAVIN